MRHLKFYKDSVYLTIPCISKGYCEGCIRWKGDLCYDREGILGLNNLICHNDPDNSTIEHSFILKGLKVYED